MQPQIRSCFVSATVISFILGFIPFVIWGIASQNNTVNWTPQYNRVASEQVTVLAQEATGYYAANYSFKPQGKLVIGSQLITKAEYQIIKYRTENHQAIYVQYDPDDPANMKLNLEDTTIDKQRQEIDKLRFYLMYLPWLIYAVLVALTFIVCFIVGCIQTRIEQ